VNKAANTDADISDEEVIARLEGHDIHNTERSEDRRFLERQHSDRQDDEDNGDDDGDGENGDDDDHDDDGDGDGDARVSGGNNNGNTKDAIVSISGLFIQACLYRSNRINGAVAACPL
jgi:hypothetical protein